MGYRQDGRGITTPSPYLDQWVSWLRENWFVTRQRSGVNMISSVPTSALVPRLCNQTLRRYPRASTPALAWPGCHQDQSGADIADNPVRCCRLRTALVKSSDNSPVLRRRSYASKHTQRWWSRTNPDPYEVLRAPFGGRTYDSPAAAVSDIRTVLPRNYFIKNFQELLHRDDYGQTAARCGPPHRTFRWYVQDVSRWMNRGLGIEG